MPSPEVQSLAAEIRSRIAEVRDAGSGSRAADLVLVMDKLAELEQAIAKTGESINAAQASFLASHRQNRILITLLTIFILCQILVLE